MVDAMIGQCEVNAMIITIVSGHIIGSHLGHIDDGPGDDHKCDADLCGWLKNVMMADVSHVIVNMTMVRPPM